MSGKERQANYAERMKLSGLVQVQAWVPECVREDIQNICRPYRTAVIASSSSNVVAREYAIVKAAIKSALLVSMIASAIFPKMLS